MIFCGCCNPIHLYPSLRLPCCFMEFRPHPMCINLLFGLHSLKLYVHSHSPPPACINRPKHCLTFTLFDILWVGVYHSDETQRNWEAIEIHSLHTVADSCLTYTAAWQYTNSSEVVVAVYLLRGTNLSPYLSNIVYLHMSRYYLKAAEILYDHPCSQNLSISAPSVIVPETGLLGYKQKINGLNERMCFATCQVF